ncbi:unnamed protein product, partial [Adineta steineri]
QNLPDPNIKPYGNSPHGNVELGQFQTIDDIDKIISIMEENMELVIETMSAVDHQLDLHKMLNRLKEYRIQMKTTLERMVIHQQELTILQQQKKQIESFNVIHEAAPAHQNATTNQDALAYEAKQDLNDEVFQAIKDIEKRIIEIQKQIDVGISTMCAAEEQFGK